MGSSMETIESQVMGPAARAVFDGTGFFYWRNMMQGIFAEKGLWRIVSGDSHMPTPDKPPGFEDSQRETTPVTNIDDGEEGDNMTGSKFDGIGRTPQTFMRQTIVDPDSDEEPEVPTRYQKWIKKNIMARNIIFRYVTKEIGANLFQYELAEGIWRNLEEMYLGGSAQEQSLAKQEIANYKYKGGSMRTYCNELGTLFSECASLGAPETAFNQVHTLAMRLPREYDTIMERLNTKLQSKWNWSETVNWIIVHEATLKARNDVSGGQAFLTSWRQEKEENQGDNGYQDFSTRGRGRGRGSRHGSIRGRGRGGGIENTCHFCKKPGHFIVNCFKLAELRGEGSNTNGDKKGKALAANAKERQLEEKEDPDLINLLLKANLDDSKKVKTKKEKCMFGGIKGTPDDGWIIDSGATMHMCRDKKYFVDMRVVGVIEIEIADGTILTSNLVGKVELPVLLNGQKTIVHLSDVVYIPTLNKNLFSTSVIDKKGFATNSEEGIFTVSYKGEPYLVAKRGDFGLFRVILMNDKNGVAYYSGVCDNLMLWHKRMGHVNGDKLMKMKKKDVVNGMVFSDQSVMADCSGCGQGKVHKQPFPDEAVFRGTCVLDLVHTDLWGPSRVSSLSGNRYMMTITDDWSRYSRVYFLKYKSEALETFKAYKAWSEKLHGVPIKRLRSDNGGEYTSLRFENFLKDEGIQHQKSVPYSPEQNGVAERLNRTLAESARSMLADKKIGMKFWAEAMNCANYIKNRVLTSAVRDVTPYEKWNGHKPDVSGFKVFGSQIYHLSNEQGKDKLEPKGIPGYFLGYDENTKGYRIYDLKRNDVVLVRNLIVMDEVLSVDPFKYNKIITIRTVIEEEKEEEESKSIKPRDKEMSEMPKHYESEDDEDVQENVEEENKNENTMEENLSELLDLGESKDRGDRNSELFSELEERREEKIPEKHTSSRMPSILASEFEGGRRTSRRIKERMERASQQANAAMSKGSHPMEPQTYKEAIACPEANRWTTAINEEMASIMAANTWELVELPPGRKPIGCKWVFKLKLNPDNSIERYKARLVAKGYTQKEGIDYEETFAPVVRFPSVRILLSIAATEDMEVHQMDIKTAFLHGELEEEIFMKQPEGFEETGQENLVCRLIKSLYGLKQAPRQWNIKLDKFLTELGFIRLSSDHSIYVSEDENGIIFIAVYVDDLLVISKSLEKIAKLKSDLKSRFEMKDLGEAKYILGIQMERDREKRIIRLTQKEAIGNMLEKYQFEKANGCTTPMELKKHNEGNAEGGVIILDDSMGLEEVEFMRNIPYRQIVGSLIYFMNCTRPDISAAVGVLSRSLNRPRKKDWEGVKRVMRYLVGTRHLWLHLGGKDTKITTWSDASYGDVPSRRSTSGFILQIGEGACCWSSKQQKVVAQSTMESEYMAACGAVKELMWVKALMGELGWLKSGIEKIFCDNQAAIAIAANPRHHFKSKHMDIRLSFVREKVENRIIALEYRSDAEMIADMMTKPIPSPKLTYCREKSGLRDVEND